MNQTTTPAALDLDKLEALARAATPGPWMRLFGERTVYDRMEDGCRGNAIVRADVAYSSRDADNLDFIAAANPAATLALIDLARRSSSAATPLAEQVRCDECKGTGGYSRAGDCTDCNGKGYNWEPIESSSAAGSEQDERALFEAWIAQDRVFHRTVIDRLRAAWQARAAIAQRAASATAVRPLDDPNMAEYLRGQPWISAYIETLECELRKAQQAAPEAPASAPTYTYEQAQQHAREAVEADRKARSASAQPVAAAPAEPIAWMDPSAGCVMDAFLWQRDASNPQYHVPVFAAPAAPVAQAPTATHGPLHLTNRKTADITTRGYNIVGYVLRREDSEEVCISAESAVRWLPQAHYWRLMHEQDGSLFRAAVVACATTASTDNNSQDPNCSCPSGNGSLAWPCSVHPPAATTASASNIKTWRERLPKGAGLSYDYAHVCAMKAEIDELRTAFAQQGAPQRCEHCDGTGDVHRADGEWAGTCTCPAGASQGQAGDHDHSEGGHHD